ncbi:cyclin-dependent kinase inhibitor 1-like isoform X1 [Polyodon spathula]|uniref:cyclin-dependent kinase inhibitor 1-like isoform X1 n=2 Tax=Polyodon spathula TaxID=7913 RepID=UPI001B7EC585|nr:cyclin-dependent kinase inhibitor 1-like isoform X1 [Polyodon spathula]
MHAFVAANCYFNCDTMAPQNRILTPSFNTSVCRSLFGPVDREQLRAEFQESMRKTLEEATHKWSFDFVNESPLEGGDFQWEGVPGGKVPVLYHPCVVRASRQGALCTKERESRRKQTSITDFYQSKRRRVQSARKLEQ